MTLSEKLIRNIFFICLAFLFIALLTFTKSMVGTLVPIFIAFFTAMFLQPFIIRLNKAKVPFWLATLIVYLIFILLSGVILAILGISFGNFVADLPELTREFRNKIIELVVRISNMSVVNQYISSEEIMTMVKETITFDNFNTLIIKPINKTLDILRGFGLYALSLFFIIPFIGSISRKVIKAFPGERGEKVNFIIDNINESIQNYMVAKSIISFLVGFISLIVLLIFRIEYALLWAAILFLFNFIPIIGSLLACCFPLIMSIIQYQNPLHLIGLLACLSFIQVLMGNIIEPQFMSRGVNLSPLIIFISLLVWGYIWGIVGVLLSVPIMSAFNIVCANIQPLKPLSVIISAEPKKRKIIELREKFQKRRTTLKNKDKDGPTEL